MPFTLSLAQELTGNMIEALLSHNWPGNVRELQNVLHRYYTLEKIVFLTPSSKIPKSSIDHLHDQKIPNQASTAAGHDYQSVMNNTKKTLIIKALELHQWNRKKTAAHSGIPLRSFYRKLKQYRIIK